jgi:hypothetical protein
MEAFYLGDLKAVQTGLGIKGVARRQDEKKFRDPGHLGAPSLELEKLTRQLYQKVSGSRAIAPHLDLERSRSKSFQHLIQAMRRLAHELSQTRLRAGG